MPREPIMKSGLDAETRARDDALRPRRLSEVIGQKAVVERLRIAINACKKLASRSRIFCSMARPASAKPRLPRSFLTNWAPRSR
jgi:hypothetical protein